MNNNIGTLVHKISCRYRRNQVYPWQMEPPQYQLSRDELHTTRQNLSDEQTVVDGPLTPPPIVN